MMAGVRSQKDQRGRNIMEVNAETQKMRREVRAAGKEEDLSSSMEVVEGVGMAVGQGGEDYGRAEAGTK